MGFTGGYYFTLTHRGPHVTPNHLRRGLNLQLKALTQTTRWPHALVMLQRARTTMGLDVVSWTTVMRACARGKAWRCWGGMEQTTAWTTAAATTTWMGGERIRKRLRAPTKTRTITCLFGLKAILFSETKIAMEHGSYFGRCISYWNTWILQQPCLPEGVVLWYHLRWKKSAGLEKHLAALWSDLTWKARPCWTKR